MAERPTTCPSCNKRLSKKQQYYRNGNFFCKKRCWMTAQEKAAAEASKAGENAPPAAGASAKEAAGTG